MCLFVCCFLLRNNQPVFKTNVLLLFIANSTYVAELSRLIKKVLKGKNDMLCSLSSSIKQHRKSYTVRKEATRSALCSAAGFALLWRLWTCNFEDILSCLLCYTWGQRDDVKKMQRDFQRVVCIQVLEYVCTFICILWGMWACVLGDLLLCVHWCWLLCLQFKEHKQTRSAWSCRISNNVAYCCLCCLLKELSESFS